MPLYKPKELSLFLQSVGATPNKKLSQNFLIDGNILRKIVKEADIQKGDCILEIGPGPGALTEILLEKGAFVVAVETDRALASSLERLNVNHQLKVIAQDALKVPVEELLALFPKKPIKLISNLPYHITTPLLTRFVSFSNEIQSIFVMVQEEVGRRMGAKPGSKDYGSITVFLEFYATVKYLFTVSRNCFYPAPKVDSAVISIVPHAHPPEIDTEAFFQMTRTAFGQRRKSIPKSLQGIYPKERVISALESLQLSPLIRPEELSCAAWIELFHLLRTKK